MLQLIEQPPTHLYRGIALSGEEFSTDLFDQALTPGGPPYTDAHGRKTDASGNEYGVYMSDNPQMVHDAYAKASQGNTLPCSPDFSLNGIRPRQVQCPNISVGYTIRTENLDVHIPFMNGAMQGIYNNGYIGDEWIADSIPPQNYAVTTLRMGGDLLHTSIDFILNSKSPQEIVSAVHAEYAERLARLHVVSEAIANLPAHQRFIDSIVAETVE